MSDIWQPKYTLTNSIVNGLTAIEAAKTNVESACLSPMSLAELSRQARVRATHYSTRIEGNRLTLEEAEEVVAVRKKVIHGRERDVAEVRNYWDALDWAESQADAGKPVTEDLVQRLYAMTMQGKRCRIVPYRSSQNVIRDSVTGGIVYMPPEASDVATLMATMIKWIRQADLSGVPTIIAAGLAHYQYVTIHPHYDGNGRTARLLATYLLHLGGYGLSGIYSLEEYHSRDIQAYYNALDVGGHHNYYMGRSEADLTQWLEYYVQVVKTVFDFIGNEAEAHSGPPGKAQINELSSLDRRARLVLALFSKQSTINSADVAQAIGLSERMARICLAKWVDDGWLKVADPSRRGRKYSLTANDG